MPRNEKRKIQYREKNVSVPDFRQEQGTYIERDTSAHNGYLRREEKEYEDYSVHRNANPLAQVSQYEAPEEDWQERPRTKEGEARAKKNNKKAQALRKKRKQKIIGRIVLSVLFLASIVIGHGAGRLHATVDAVLNQRNLEDVVDLSSVAVNESVLGYDKEITNILLVGADKRADWKEAGRSDAVMIATLDLKHKRIKLTSLMRDMYLPIPEHGENKFNAAYSFGGVALLYQTIANNFDIKIDSYVVVDFAAFKTVINTIGGVEIELTDAEHKYLTTAYKKGSVLKLKQGLNNMNGTQALAYTRIRQDIRADFGRTERQRKVLQSIFTKAKKMSYSQLVELASAIMPSISTDLSNDEILSLLTSVIMLGTTQIDQMRIPIDHSYSSEKRNGMLVLIPDFVANKSALHEFIFEYDGTDRKEN